MDNSIEPPQLNTKKGKIAQFFGELSKSRKTALIVVVLIASLGAGWLVFSKAETPNPVAPPAEPCPSGQVLINGECSTCPSETYIKDGKCVGPICSPSADGSSCAPKCPTGKVLINNVCSFCPSDTYFVNGECKTPDCPLPPNNGSSSNEGSAPLCEFKCPENQVLVANRCMTGNCPEDMFNNNGVCSYCPSEEDYIKNNKCINPNCFRFNNNADQSQSPPPLCDSDDPQVHEYKPAGTYDDDIAFYTRGWETAQDDTKNTYFNGSERRTDGKNDNWPLAFKFKGNNIKIYGSKGTTKGYAKVTIDGAPETGIDYSDSTDKNQELVFDSGELEEGYHLLKLTGIKYNGNTTHEVRYISVDKIVVSGSPVQEERCPEGTTKQADGTCKLDDPSKDCPSGTTKQADGTCKTDGKGGGNDNKIDSDITKKPQAKTMSEKLVKTGRFLLLPAIVAVIIILIAGGLYVVTKKKK